jgi:hypothetical protein
VVFTKQLHCPSAATLVRPSPSKVGQFSFEYCPLSHKTSSRIHHLPGFERLACHPISTFSLCASSNLCLVLAVPLKVDLSPHHHSQACCCLFIEGSALRVRLFVPPLLSGTGSALHPYPHCQCYIIICILCFSGFFCWERGVSVCQGAALDCFQKVGRGVTCGV